SSLPTRRRALPPSVDVMVTPATSPSSPPKSILPYRPMLLASSFSSVQRMVWTGTAACVPGRRTLRSRVQTWSVGSVDRVAETEVVEVHEPAGFLRGEVEQAEAIAHEVLQRVDHLQGLADPCPPVAV